MLCVGRLVESAKQTPGLLRHIHIFRVAVGAAFLVEFGLKNVQERGFLSVWIAGLLSGEAAGNLPADKADPLFCDKADSGYTAMVMLVGVGKAENPVVGVTFRM
jgi:hypothetical protein